VFGVADTSVPYVAAMSKTTRPPSES
jgi:hypothetical protein